MFDNVPQLECPLLAKAAPVPKRLVSSLLIMLPTKSKCRRFGSYQPILLAFIILLVVRVNYVNQKQNLYGDELSSVSLAFGNPGWGSETFETGKIYTGKELRETTYIDSECPEAGLLHDLKSLYNDNDDPSHASLYYMALRCALSGIDVPDMATLVWRGCGLNILFFCVSFFVVFSFLKRAFHDSVALQTFCLLLAFANPVSISISLFVREYAMSEMFFGIFALWFVNFPSCIKCVHSKRFARWALSGVVVIACFVSCGYFNAVLVILAFSLIGCHCIREKNGKSLVPLFAIAIGAVILCVVMYRGFFNFIADERTAEVSGKLKGGDLISNLKATMSGLVYVFIKRVFTVPLFCASVLCIVYLGFRKRIPGLAIKQSALWLLGITMLWIIIVLWLATWKSERFISPSVPIFLSIVYGCLYPLFRLAYKGFPWIAVAIVIVFILNTDSVGHLEKTDSRVWRAGNERRIFLYGPNLSEINTMNQLIPYIGDDQKCVIIEKVADIRRFSQNTNGEIHVFGYKGCDELRSQSDFACSYDFNTWMDDYVLKGRSVN